MALTEIKGSRAEPGDGKMKHGMYLGVTSSASDQWDHTSVVFYTNKAGTLESGDTGRRLVDEDPQPEVLPGLILIRRRFSAFIPYS